MNAKIMSRLCNIDFLVILNGLNAIFTMFDAIFPKFNLFIAEIVNLANQQYEGLYSVTKQCKLIYVNVTDKKCKSYFLRPGIEPGQMDLKSYTQPHRYKSRLVPQDRTSVLHTIPGDIWYFIFFYFFFFFFFFFFFVSLFQELYHELYTYNDICLRLFCFHPKNQTCYYIDAGNGSPCGNGMVR